MWPDPRARAPPTRPARAAGAAALGQAERGAGPKPQELRDTSLATPPAELIARLRRWRKNARRTLPMAIGHLQRSDPPSTDFPDLAWQGGGWWVFPALNSSTMARTPDRSCGSVN